jgi:DNA-binding Xre family transcriptional regulator
VEAGGVRVCQDCGRECDPAQGEIKPKGRSCRECIRQRRNDYDRVYRVGYYERNHDALLAKARAYRAEHYDEIRMRQAIYDEAHREQARVRSKAWYEANKERHAERVARWKAEHPERQKLYRQRHYENLKRTRQGWEKYLEDQRLSWRLLAERRGRPVKPVSLEEYRERYGSGWGKSITLPAEPLLPFIRRALRTESETELAGRAGISDKRIREVLNGNVSNFALVTADKLCLALGYTLSLIYPEAA